MPLLETKGAASAQGFGLTLQQAAANYIEEVFQTWLYTGNGSTQTITNGIDLSTKGGLVWMKGRSGATDHALYDTARGATFDLVSNSTAAQTTQSTGLTSFNSTGFSLGALAKLNTNAATYASWTFRKQPKFFDVVTYTGNGTAGRTVAHSLGSVPGCMIVKCTSNPGGWNVYHRSLGATKFLYLDSTLDASNTNAWNSTAPTSTVFTVGGSGIEINDNGRTYVAYLFAHDAGGFGLTGTDNVISCGSYVGTSANFVDVNLGYEPQWFMVKRASDTSPWFIIDNMRNMSYGNTSNLQANASNAEQTTVPQVIPSATGISLGFSGGGSGYNVNGVTYIYIAIRRGPMKTPTTGTSVFSPNTSSAGTGTTLTTNFPTDLQMQALRTSAVSDNTSFFDRLRGFSTTPTNETGQRLISSATDAETSPANQTRYFTNTGFQIPSNWGGSSVIYLNFRRAPGFFDVVCYTGTGAGQTVNHNLGVVPELIILKNRSSGSTDWPVKCPVGLTDTGVVYLNLDLSNATGVWQTGDTSTTFKTRASSNLFYNQSGQTYVAYLFATVAGVSKVGAYTGTGALQTINCGFTGGARFVLIKRTDSTGDWWVYDSARGISSGNDPYLLLNTTDGEVTGTNYVDTTSVGFQVTAAAPAGLNANGGTFVFLAIS